MLSPHETTPRSASTDISETSRNKPLAIGAEACTRISERALVSATHEAKPTTGDRMTATGLIKWNWYITIGSEISHRRRPTMVSCHVRPATDLASCNGKGRASRFNTSNADSL